MRDCRQVKVRELESHDYCVVLRDGRRESSARSLTGEVAEAGFTQLLRCTEVSYNRKQ